jgi:hypothetical protein
MVYGTLMQGGAYVIAQNVYMRSRQGSLKVAQHHPNDEVDLLLNATESLSTDHDNSRKKSLMPASRAAIFRSRGTDQKNSTPRSQVFAGVFFSMD